MDARDRLLALLVPILWGLNFVVIDEGIGDVPPLLFLAIRFTFVVFPLILFVPKPDAPWRVIIAIGAFMSLGQFSLLYLGLALGMPAGLASLVLQVQVMATVLLAWLTLGERISRQQMLGVVTGAAGLAIVAVAHGARAPIVPLLFIVGAAISWAIGNVVTRQAKVASGLSVVVWSGIVVPLPCLALSLAIDGPHAIGQALAGFDGVAIASTAYTVVGASLVGYTLFNGLLSRHPAGTVVPYILLVPPVGIASAWLVQGEAPTALEIVGGIVMMAGVATATFAARPRRDATVGPQAADGAAAGPARATLPALAHASD